MNEFEINRHLKMTTKLGYIKSWMKLSVSISYCCQLTFWNHLEGNDIHFIICGSLAEIALLSVRFSLKIFMVINKRFFCYIM